MAKAVLDAIDRKILKYLIKNARMPFLESRANAVFREPPFTSVSASSMRPA